MWKTYKVFIWLPKNLGTNFRTKSSTGQGLLALLTLGLPQPYGSNKKGDQHPFERWLPLLNLVVNLVRIFEDWHK